MTTETERVLLTADAARALTEQIKAGVAELLPLIREAFERRADRALGYASWSEYCDAELRGLRIPVQDRADAVAQLRGAGMSTRAIGSALGISHEQARQDAAAGVNDLTPGGRTTGLDGKSYPDSRPLAPEFSAAVRDALDEHEQEQSDRAALEELAEELGMHPDPQAEAQRATATATLYPLFDAIALIATMPAPGEVMGMVQPYQRYRLDDLPAALAWLTGFVQKWKEAA